MKSGRERVAGEVRRLANVRGNFAMHLLANTILPSLTLGGETPPGQPPRRQRSGALRAYELPAAIFFCATTRIE